MLQPTVSDIHVDEVILQDTDSKSLADDLLETLSHRQGSDASATPNNNALLVYVGNKVSKLLTTVLPPSVVVMQAKVKAQRRLNLAYLLCSYGCKTCLQVRPHLQCDRCTIASSQLAPQSP